MPDSSLLEPVNQIATLPGLQRFIEMTGEVKLLVQKTDSFKPKSPRFTGLNMWFYAFYPIDIGKIRMLG